VPKNYSANKKYREKIRRFNELAELLEKHLNIKIEQNPDNIQQYVYGAIAAELGLARREVEDVLYGVDGGGNGLTVVKDPQKAA
jgi:hypothetical protein